MELNVKDIRRAIAARPRIIQRAKELKSKIKFDGIHHEFVIAICGDLDKQEPELFVYPSTDADILSCRAIKFLDFKPHVKVWRVTPTELFVGPSQMRRNRADVTDKDFEDAVEHALIRLVNDSADRLLAS